MTLTITSITENIGELIGWAGTQSYFEFSSDYLYADTTSITAILTYSLANDPAIEITHTVVMTVTSCVAQFLASPAPDVVIESTMIGEGQKQYSLPLFYAEAVT